ncbi:MAG: hypothetical protein GTO62_00830, partial [Planctomycetales bacterium]|nr:hypothetical protein [Planctomycetales bacterium]
MLYTAEHMSQLGAEPGDWGKSFRLMADIDLSGHAGGQLDVIGTGAESPFAGVFDGGGHRMSGFVGSGRVGMFGYVNGMIKNVGLVGPNVNEKLAYHVGSLVGDNYGMVVDCYVEDTNVAAGGWQAGGLVGYNKGTVANCRSSGTVSGDSAGGLVGANRGVIEGCWSAATVTGDDGVGGLVGDNANGTILNCR